MKTKLPLKHQNTEYLKKLLEDRGIKPGDKPKVKNAIPKPGKKK